ncbi:MAG TPA: methyltransferase domain-containing protein [Rhodopila sp.]
MHDTAHDHGRLFFQLYHADTFRTVVELGSQDVNGALRDHCPPGVHYIGLDMIPARGVDVVVSSRAPLPFAPDFADAIVTSSAFEHDVCFWDTFLELTRILRPGGLLYLNAPANGDFHRYPLDCWRFYPDAGAALVQWAARRDIQIELIESFIGLPQAERWADFVAVFRKAGGGPLTARGRIADHVPAINIHHRDRPSEAPLGSETESMPDTTIARSLETELAAASHAAAKMSADRAAAQQANTKLSADLAASGADLAAARQTVYALSADLAASHEQTAALVRNVDAADHRISDLEQALANAERALRAVENSTSWRLTAGLRRLTILLRGH